MHVPRCPAIVCRLLRLQFSFWFAKICRKKKLTKRLTETKFKKPTDRQSLQRRKREGKREDPSLSSHAQTDSSAQGASRQIRMRMVNTQPMALWPLLTSRQANFCKTDCQTESEFNFIWWNERNTPTHTHNICFLFYKTMKTISFHKSIFRHWLVVTIFRQNVGKLPKKYLRN